MERFIDVIKNLCKSTLGKVLLCIASLVAALMAICLCGGCSSLNTVLRYEYKIARVTDSHVESELGVKSNNQ